jgi:hypothetical protein
MLQYTRFWFIFPPCAPLFFTSIMIMHPSKKSGKEAAGRSPSTGTLLQQHTIGFADALWVVLLPCNFEVYHHQRSKESGIRIVLHSSLRNVDCRTRGPIAQLALEKRFSAASTQQLQQHMRCFNHKVFYRQDQETHFLPSFCCPPPVLVVCCAGRPRLDSPMFCLRNCRSAPELLYGQQHP